MAESYNNPPPSGSHNPPPPPGAGSEDNEPRIDGDGQEVNALRFLGAGGPPAPPAPSITPVSSGVSQPLPSQLNQQPPAPPQTPHQHQPTASSIPSQNLIPNTPGGVSSYDPYSDPSGVGAGAYHPHGGAMQIPPGPMSGPYGMAAGPPGAPPGMMGGGPMMMMPQYGYGMYPSPYGFMPPAAPYPGMAPQQPQNSQTQFLAMLNVLRVHNPKYYREWYKKYTAHKRNPDRVPFPPIPQVPGFPQMGGPGSSATLPTFGRSRKESSRSSVNGDTSYSRGGHPNDSFADYPSLPHVPNTSSLPRGSGGHHHRPPSGRASVNGDYKSSGAGGLHPEDDFEIEGAADPNLSMAGHLGQNSYLHSTFNTDFQTGPESSSDRDRRPHSGRSSTIGETYRLQPADIYGGGNQQDSLSRYNDSLYTPYDSMIGSEQQQQREPSPIRRMTPMKFSTFHCIATMSPLGHMIRIKNSGTVLEFLKMKQYVGHLPEYREMESFPGPLTQSSTHKNTVIQFCKRKIKEARSNPAQLDRENYILLWEFLMLMLRQNGMVVGSDIAELLLTAVQEQKQQQLLQKQVESLNLQKEEVRDSVEGSDGAGGESSDDKEEGEGESSGEDADKRKVHPPKNIPSQDSLSSTDAPSGSTIPIRDEKKLIDEFCEHLLYGHKKDALDFAMDNGLWGHALFFASKMDERSYGHVLARFANGIPLNSPLQTLYHIMCGKQPASVTSCGDGGTTTSWEDEETKTYGDWKPHLAMLLSNSGYKPEVEQRAILTLGDTLQSKHHCFAAQFCFLMGHEEFRKDSRLGCLLGYSPQKKNIVEATQMTEVYEFARKLADPGFSLGLSFLQSKLDYAKRLVSYGFVQEALSYCEEITKALGQSGKRRGGDEVDELITLSGNTLKIAERIAVADENGTASSTWVEELRKMTKEPGLYDDTDSSRKLSLVSSTNQDHSEQPSYASSINQQQQQQTPQLPQSGDPNNTYDPYGGHHTSGGYNSTQAPSSVAPSDLSMAPPYNPDGGMITNQSTEVAQHQQGDIIQQQQQQPPQQTQDNSWGNQNNSMMMNGGFHLSQPPQQSPNQQQQQQNMYEPPQIPMMNNPPQSHGQDDTGYQMQQPSGMDTGYSTGGYNDKMSTAAPTINNNSWYNPYDSQPSLGGGGAPTSTGHYQPNSSPVKKKSVRFEDEHQHHPHGGLVMEGNGSSLVDGGVQSVVRARISHGGANRPTSLDLKSALKTSTVGTDRQHTHYRERQTSSSVMNGGSSSNSTSREENGTPPLADLERCSTKKEDKSQYFEVEYKSTYPIDEPILQSPNLSIARPPPPQVGSFSSMRLVNSKKQMNSSLVCPPVNHPYPLHQLSNNVATSVASSSSASSSIPTRPRGGKTYQVDRECCDVNQPCEDHGDLLDDVDEEEEDDELDEDEVDGEDDEEGGIGGSGGGGGVRLGKLNNNDIEGVENGGYHHRHQYARFENKTDSSKPPVPQSSSSNDKKAAADKKKAAKEAKGGLDGGGQQDKGWFGGLFKKLTLKPNNQMILPDDKNPTIVWDPQKKQWVNTAGDGEDDSAPAGPPPKDSELMGGPPKGQAPPPMMMPNGPQQPQMMMQPQQNQQQQQQQQPMMMGGGGGMPPQYQQQQQQQNSGAYQQQPQQQQNKGLPSMNPSLQQQSQQGMMAPVGGGNSGPMDNQMNSGMPSVNNNNNSMNKYKLQRGRGMKGYVDVLNPNGSSTSPPAAAPMQPNHLPQGGGGAPVPNLFIPPPMPQGGQGGDSGPVSFLTAPSPSAEDVPGQQGQENSLGQSQPPPMFNPAQFQGYPQGQ